jgi:hypothetical protein
MERERPLPGELFWQDAEFDQLVTNPLLTA